MQALTFYASDDKLENRGNSARIMYTVRRTVASHRSSFMFYASLLGCLTVLLFRVQVIQDAYRNEMSSYSSGAPTVFIMLRTQPSITQSNCKPMRLLL